MGSRGVKNMPSGLTWDHSRLLCIFFLEFTRFASVTRFPQRMIQSNHPLKKISDALVAVRDDGDRQSSFMIAIGN